VTGDEVLPGSLCAEAERCLRALAGPDARLREDQWTAVRALVEDRRRALVVQRTGWGKSAVYFTATALLRSRGAGPCTLPLYREPMDLVQIHHGAGVTRRWRLFRARCSCGWRTWPRLSTAAASRDLASHQAGQMLWRHFPPPWWTR
jgi:hypothetical protein